MIPKTKLSSGVGRLVKIEGPTLEHHGESDVRLKVPYSPSYLRASGQQAEAEQSEGQNLTPEEVKKVQLQSTKGKALRIGIYCGSFNPPHAGHVNIAEKVVAEAKLDLIFVVSDRTSAYKALPNPKIRDTMNGVAFGHIEEARVLSPQMGKHLGEGEMWDVMRVVADKYPGAELFNIMGTDTLEWYRTLPSEQQRPDGIESMNVVVNLRDHSVEVPEALGDIAVHAIDTDDAGYSSTAVRNAIGEGRRHEALDRGTYDLAKKHGLYGLGD